MNKKRETEAEEKARVKAAKGAPQEIPHGHGARSRLGGVGGSRDSPAGASPTHCLPRDRPSRPQRFRPILPCFAVRLVRCHAAAHRFLRGTQEPSLRNQAARAPLPRTPAGTVPPKNRASDRRYHTVPPTGGTKPCSPEPLPHRATASGCTTPGGTVPGTVPVGRYQDASAS